MKQLFLLCLLVLLRLEGFSESDLNKKDVVCIYFQSGYNNDSICLYINDKLIFKGVINTDPMQGLAHAVRIKRPKGEKYSIKIKISGCEIKEQIVDSKWNYIGIKYFLNCDLEYFFSEERIRFF